ncbi:MAG: hypothetical protein LPK19_00420 [Hymenobacteraceae bacterium]|nr:hypothetical protein [Hymenobacteraceae bacterium]MDX5394632.1 hypothetical protein [Hymenobacteraceae bacterium]MDX5510663.1 hypothetical protein [Hymenobacteraceae bacterium]
MIGLVIAILLHLGAVTGNTNASTNATNPNQTENGIGNGGWDIDNNNT